MAIQHPVSRLATSWAPVGRLLGPCRDASKNGLMPAQQKHSGGGSMSRNPSTRELVVADSAAATSRASVRPPSPDCFWCGAVLFTAGTRLVCPEDGWHMDAASHLSLFTPRAT